jgi:ketosteroid isomerase-like protein
VAADETAVSAWPWHATDDYEAVAWMRPGVSPRAILGRHSRRHLMGADERLLCGVRIPWERVHGSHEGDCERCFSIAAGRRAHAGSPA